MTTRAGLRLHRGRPAGTAARAAYEALLRDVLGLAPVIVRDEAWTPFSLFDGDRCVANIDAAVLPLVVDGVAIRCAGLRSVAVDPGWRGRGLFRALMAETLEWCDARVCGPVLLYAAEPRLYEGFGFRPVAQHAFVGAAPAPRGTGPIEPAPPAPPALLASIVARRAPISQQAALMVGADLVMANIAGDADLEVACVRSLEAAVVFERSGDTLVLIDIAAPLIPPLADLLAALGPAPRRIKTLFPPDRLGWQGTPVGEETGLMARGILPDAMTLPFMFPPTAEF